MTIEIIEHKSSSYGPRTWHNAHVGDVTAAFAVNFNTAGEKLTKKAAGAKLVSVLLIDDDLVFCARELFKALRSREAKVLNVAGNGIYTMHKHGWTQERVNQYVYDTLKLIKPHWELELVVSGGQTGADIAGAVAGVALGYDVQVTLPKGYKQRFEDGVDIVQTKADVMAQIQQGVDGLKL